MFLGSMLPNWLQCRTEVSQGAKLAYARLAQHAGKAGNCFPKQKTLASELGVGERTVRDYLRELEVFALIEREQRGLNKSNRYFFLHHPWMQEGQPETTIGPGQERRRSSSQNRRDCSGQERQETSVPNSEKKHGEVSHVNSVHPHNPPEGETVKCTGSTSHQEEEIYSAYPKQVGKPAALRAIRRALTKWAFDFLLERTRLYAQTCNSPAEFIPHPTTWFNQERFNDDPATWRRVSSAGGRSQPAVIRPDKFGCGVTKL